MHWCTTFSSRCSLQIYDSVGFFDGFHDRLAEPTLREQHSHVHQRADLSIGEPMNASQVWSVFAEPQPGISFAVQRLNRTRRCSIDVASSKALLDAAWANVHSGESKSGNARRHANALVHSISSRGSGCCYRRRLSLAATVVEESAFTLAP